MKLKIVRKYPRETYIIGDLSINGEQFSDSLELPWLDNQPNISCIPEGIYVVKMLYSNRFGRLMPTIMDVPDRSNVLMHAANFSSELRGCVATGKNSMTGGLYPSRPYSDKLNEILLATDEEITLEITSV